jgi:hypothetical protein
MTATIIRYLTKPESTGRNTQLVEAVFRELAAAAPDGVHYAVFRGEDGSFFHLFAHDGEEAGDKLTSLPAFEAFRTGGAECRATAPERTELTVIGNYGMLAE